MATNNTVTVANFYRWTDEDTRGLISWRMANPTLFTGKKHSSLKAYSIFLKEKGLEGKVEAKAIKKRWENLVSKYKVLKRPRTGVSTDSGKVTAISWKWYLPMDEAIRSRLSVTPPVIFFSASREVLLTRPPAEEKGSTSTLSTPKRQRVDRMDDVLSAIKDGDEEYQEAMMEMQKEQERRDDEKEREAKEAVEREERHHNELMTREERRHWEMVEKEERFYREMMEREERFYREMVEREERFYREMREREERRDRETAGREERLLAILEKLSNRM